MGDSPNTPRWKRLKKKIPELDLDPHALDADPEFQSLGKGGLSIGIYPASKFRPLAGDTVVKIANKEGIESLRREVLLTRKLSHNNIRKSRSSLTEGQNYAYAHFENAPGVDLMELLMNHPFPEPHQAPDISSDFPGFEGIRHVLRQILHGLAYLCKKGIVHNDLKPANIMVDAKTFFEITPETKIKIIDLGLSFKLDDIAVSLKARGDINWSSPETWNESVHKTDRKDVFAFGAITYAAFSGHMMCYEQKHKGDFNLFREMLGREHARMMASKRSMWAYPAIREMITICTNYYPEHRPTAESLLNSPFFTRKLLSRYPLVTDSDEST